MLDEEMDHMIREAADKHHPAYNDKAWDKMEKLLDKHLPQEKDRKRPLFFLLLFLLLGGGVFFTIYQFTGNNRMEGIAEKKTSEQPAYRPVDKQTDVQRPGVKNDAGDPGNTAAVQDDNLTGESEEEALNTSGEKGSRPGSSNKNIDANIVKNKKQVSGTKSRSKMKIAGAEPSVVTAGYDNEEEPGNTVTKKQGNRKKSDGKKNVIITAAVPEEEENNEPVTVTVPAEINKETSVKEEQNKPEPQKEEAKKTGEEKDKKLVATEEKPSASPPKKKSKKKPAGNFGITVSAGPDLSFVSLNELGKVTLMYGAGLSYRFAKQRIMVRTGFYSSRKIYSATPDQYQPTGGNYPYLYEVAANCKVYEIPVSVSYHFGSRKNHNWFGSAGLSSFLMKTEYYDYQYKRPNGQTYNYERTIQNENKHYFSVLTLSGGYQYNVNKWLSFQGEPYVKLPLGGVGFGKVKLNSVGILFTATVKPFAIK